MGGLGFLTSMGETRAGVECAGVGFGDATTVGKAGVGVVAEGEERMHRPVEWYLEVAVAAVAEGARGEAVPSRGGDVGREDAGPRRIWTEWVP